MGKVGGSWRRPSAVRECCYNYTVYRQCKEGLCIVNERALCVIQWHNLGRFMHCVSVSCICGGREGDFGSGCVLCIAYFHLQSYAVRLRGWGRRLWLVSEIV
eukprot:7106887-Prymnesium_polylepis.1